MFPADRARHRPRSLVTALVLIAIGFSCLWLAETMLPRVQAAPSSRVPTESASTLAAAH